MNENFPFFFGAIVNMAVLIFFSLFMEEFVFHFETLKLFKIKFLNQRLKSTATLINA